MWELLQSKTSIGTRTPFFTKINFLPISNSFVCYHADCTRQDAGSTVANYRQLLERVAEIAFVNPEFVLLFRGQTEDHSENGQSTLYPTMFRLPAGENLYAQELIGRYQRLRQREKALVDTFKRKYGKRFARNQLLRWAILQHYEVCPTPLLDVTHSLLVGASFAFADKTAKTTYTYLYVLGLPQISGSVTVTSDQAVQIVRLSSVCPPTTLRPYCQEGYLIGTFPVLDTIDEKIQYRRSEVDGANRLIAKFRLKRKGFWKDSGFSSLPEEALYPNEENDFNHRIRSLRD